MKQKITNPDKSIELMENEKPSDDAVSDSAEEIETLNMYWFAYAYPFMPMIDFTIFFVELRKMVKNCFLNKKERKNHQ